MKTKAVKDEVTTEKDITCDVTKPDFLNCERMRMSRRTFVKMAGVTAGALALGNLGLIRTSYGKVVPPGQTPLPGNKIPQFVDPLPLLDLNLGTATGMKTIVAGAAEIELHMREFQASVMPSTFVPATGPGTYSGTWVFGYIPGGAVPLTARDTYIGPVIVATKGNPTQVRYVNNLTANNIHWRDWIDKSLHWANPGGEAMETSPGVGNGTLYTGPVPAVPHLHGGEVPAVIDGGPEAWFLSDEAISGSWKSTGDAYYTKGGAALNEAIYCYPNDQEAAPLWFHDHLLGGTRINATFAGLAGAYPIIDPSLVLPVGLHPIGLGADIGGLPERPLVPLVIQDRMFDTNGQLFFPIVGVNPEHPIWVPEFVGDTIVVNGKVWPFLNVDRQRYRFFLINGSNSRPYDMFLQDMTSGIKGPRMWVIATDGGYLDAPVLIDPNATKKSGIQKSLVMMPGERYEIIIDFADPVWQGLLTANRVTLPLNLVLRNTAPTVNGNPNASLDGRIMQFRVSATAPIDTSYDPSSGIPIRSGELKTIKRLVNTTTGALAAGVTANNTRLLTLNEITGAGGPLEALVNNSKWNGKRPDNFAIPGSITVKGLNLTELPKEGDTEIWEIVNLTADAHPIHLHGVQFQIMNREAFNTAGFNAAYAAAFTNLAGIIDPMTGSPYPNGVFIPAYGPPLDYLTGNPRALGGNPDVMPFLSGVVMPPLSYEAGWKDTAIMKPGEVTRIAVRFAPQNKDINAIDAYFPYDPNASGHGAFDGYYVWHCHITDHEDNEMMRPDQFQPKPGAVRTYVQGTHY